MIIIEPSVVCIGASTPSIQKALMRIGQMHKVTVHTSQAEAYCRKLMAVGDLSLLREVTVTFKIVADYALAHEFALSHPWSMRQEAVTYCNYVGKRFQSQVCCIEPPDMTEEQVRIWYMGCQVAHDHYIGLVDAGVHPNVAKSVLPLGTKTQFLVTFDLKQWREFIQIHAAPKAQIQLRQISKLILDEFMALAPILFEDINKAVPQSDS